MITAIYEFSDYREYLKNWIDSQSLRGAQGKLATSMGISSTLMSLILKGEKNLSLEQAAEASDFLGLNVKESDFFFLLVESGKAGTHKLRRKLDAKIKLQQDEAKKIAERLVKDKELTDEQKSIFYSSWIHTGIRNLSALEKYHDVTGIAERLKISEASAQRALKFLLENGFCKMVDGKLSYGPTYTHVGADSPYVNKHHQNWRVRGFQQMDLFDHKNFYYTCPMSLSEEAIEKTRALILKMIEDMWKVVGPSPSEEVYCLNVDWFKY